MLNLTLAYFILKRENSEKTNMLESLKQLPSKPFVLALIIPN
jgi:hypothetical protein